MADSQKRITGAALASLLGVARQTVTDWKHAGCPSQPDKRTGAPTYLPSEVWAWDTARKAKAAAPADMEKAKAEQVLRKLTEEADRIALENAQTRGELLHVSVLEAKVATEHDRMRGTITKVPGSFARSLSERFGMPMADAQAWLHQLADEMLTDLQNAPEDEDGSFLEPDAE